MSFEQLPGKAVHAARASVALPRHSHCMWAIPEVLSSKHHKSAMYARSKTLDSPKSLGTGARRAHCGLSWAPRRCGSGSVPFWEIFTYCSFFQEELSPAQHLPTSCSLPISSRIPVGPPGCPLCPTQSSSCSGMTSPTHSDFMILKQSLPCLTCTSLWVSEL